MKVLLDPSIYELTDHERAQKNAKRQATELQHVRFMSILFNFLLNNKKFGIQIHLTQNQYDLLCNPSNHPWNQYDRLTNKNQIMHIFGTIMSSKPFIEQNLKDAKCVPCDTMNEFTSSICFEDYCKHILISHSNKDTFIFYGRLNHFNKQDVEYSSDTGSIIVTPIYNINENFNNSLRKLLLLNPKYQTKPLINNPLPNVDLCKKYIELQIEEIKNGNDKISTFTKFGTEVALRNNYYKDQYLESINRGRNIFTNYYNEKIHLSLDLLHGNIEVYNAFGEHQDEYSYDNIAQNKQDRSGRHDINV